MTDDQLDELIHALDNYALDVSCLEKCLPTSDKNMKEMRAILRERMEALGIGAKR